VVANPEPQDTVLDVDAKSAMVKADSARPKPADALELKRPVMGVSLEKPILLVG
jgi:hypothetical protein